MIIVLLKGIGSIVLGVIILWLTKKFPPKEPSVTLPILNGYFAGIVFIIIGIVYLLKEL